MDHAQFHAFGVAAIGMATGLIQYTIGRRNLGTQASIVPDPLPRSRWTMVVGLAAVVAAVVVFLVVAGVITAANLSDVVVVVCGIAAVVYFAVILTSSKITVMERSRMLSFIPLFVTNAVLSSLYQQQFTVVEIYADRQQTKPFRLADAHRVGAVVQPGVHHPARTRVRTAVDQTRVPPALDADQIRARSVIMGLAFLLFLLSSGGAGPTTPLLAVGLILLVFAVGELLISPVGFRWPPRSPRLRSAARRSHCTSCLLPSARPCPDRSRAISARSTRRRLRHSRRSRNRRRTDRHWAQPDGPPADGRSALKDLFVSSRSSAVQPNCHDHRRRHLRAPRHVH